MSTDGRVNAFISVARGTGIPEGQSDYVGTITKDTKDTNDEHPVDTYSQWVHDEHPWLRCRKQVSEDFKVSARAWALDEHLDLTNEELPRSGGSS